MKKATPRAAAPAAPVATVIVTPPRPEAVPTRSGPVEPPTCPCCRIAIVRPGERMCDGCP